MQFLNLSLQTLKISNFLQVLSATYIVNNPIHSQKRVFTQLSDVLIDCVTLNPTPPVHSTDSPYHNRSYHNHKWPTPRWILKVNSYCVCFTIAACHFV